MLIVLARLESRKARVAYMKSILKIRDFKIEIRRAQRLAEERIANGENADEFVEIGEADGFKLYITASKTVQLKPVSFHDNPRDVFMLVIDGKMELTFENGEKQPSKRDSVSFYQKT